MEKTITLRTSGVRELIHDTDNVSLLPNKWILQLIGASTRIIRSRKIADDVVRASMMMMNSKIPTYAWMKFTSCRATYLGENVTHSKAGGEGGKEREKGHVNSVFQREAVAFQAKEVKTKFIDLDRRESTYHVEGQTVHCA